MKHISILGSTGSIGKNTVDIALKHPEQFKVVALAAHSSVVELKRQILLLHPELVSVGTEEAREALVESLAGSGFSGEIVIGDDGLLAVATIECADMLMIALVGSKGLGPLMAGIEAGKDIAFVNKEAMVMAGPLVMDAARRKGVNLVPVDSEHSAIFQCLLGENKDELDHVTLTSSGGPFRLWSAEEIAVATPAQAINHPRWSMGAKISVDSATLMNKGLEVIEAKWLFDLQPHQIEVMVHPQSIIHSMVEFCDGSVKALLGVSDMRLAILYGLSYPKRLPLPIEKLDLIKWGTLSFEPVNKDKFKALSLCEQACETGGSLPAVVNAANEIAVDSFLKEAITFGQITELIEDVMHAHRVQGTYGLEEIIEIDAWARDEARQWVQKHVGRILV